MAETNFRLVVIYSLAEEKIKVKWCRKEPLDKTTMKHVSKFQRKKVKKKRTANNVHDQRQS